MNVLERIQAWYKAQAGGGRRCSVRIETLEDHPGWSVRIELAGTPLENVELPPYKEGGGARDWLALRIKDGRFEGFGDPTKLQAILFAFLDLAERSARPLRRAARR